jgi:hypothetical protein
MKKLYFVWGMLVLLIIISLPLSVSAARQPKARQAVAHKTAHYNAQRQVIKKVQTAPASTKKASARISGGVRVMYIHPKPPWFWNLPALFLIGTGIFLLGLISGRVWKMGPIPRPAPECCGEETEEPNESWLQRLFGRFQKNEASQQQA